MDRNDGLVDNSVKKYSHVCERARIEILHWTTYVSFLSYRTSHTGARIEILGMVEILFAQIYRTLTSTRIEIWTT